MTHDSSKPINVITVLCDTRRLQQIALTCRCGWRWIERIPGELHESQMIAQFQCEKCNTLYHLQNKQLRRADATLNPEELRDARQQQSDKQAFARIVTNDKKHYDS